MPMPTEPSDLKSVPDLPESGWTKFFIILGILNLAAIPVVLAISGRSATSVVIAAFAGAISCFLSSRLIQLLSDCRNLLRHIADRIS
jgi:hypothetical protein